MTKSASYDGVIFSPSFGSTTPGSCESVQSSSGRERHCVTAVNCTAALLLCLFFFLKSVSAQPADSTWQYSKKVVVNTSSTGAGTTADIYNFPLLITLTSANFDFALVGANGEDLRFTKANGETALPYEIELWEKAASLARIWVKVDTVKANLASQYIFMYWGKIGATSLAKSSDVFASSHAAVYHMNNDPSGTAPQLRDQTINANNGYASGLTSASLIDGVVGKGVSFNGSSSKFGVLDNANLKMTGDFTLSLWMKKAVQQKHRYAKMLHKGNHNKKPYGAYMLQLGNDTASSQISFQVGNTDSTSPLVQATVKADVWVHVAGVYQSGMLRLYIDGADSGSVSNAGKTIMHSTDSLGVGSHGTNQGTVAFYQGVLDEVRIENVGRSASWIKMSYMNQRSGDGCVRFEDPVPQAPIILADPRDTTVVAGTSASFSANASGTEPKTFSWYRVKGTSRDSVGAGNVVTIASATAADSGASYYCIVRNVIGVDTSRSAVLRVVSKPSITAHPRDTTVLEGSDATFRITASGYQLTYQWYKNDTLVMGTAATQSLGNVPFSDSGATFKCVISNLAGSVTSAKVILNVAPYLPSSISQDPQPDTVLESKPASFSVVASGSPPLTYRWYRSGSSEVVGTAAAFAITSAKLTDNDAVYYCIVSNRTGSDTSANAKLTVLEAQAPQITVEPDDAVAQEGKNVAFTVTAIGQEPLTYAWLKNGSAVVLSTTNTLNLTNIQKSSAGSYLCIVSNMKGSDSSRTAQLVVFSQSDVYNPITVKAEFEDPAHMRLKISNYRSLPEATASGGADSVAIWYRTGRFPEKPFETDARYLGISIGLMKQRTGDVFDTVVTLPATGPECTVYYAVGSVRWKPDSIPPFIVSNGDSVKMCDVGRVTNNLTLSAGKVTAGTVELKWNGSDSVRIWWGKEAIPLTYDIPSERYTPAYPARSVTSYTVSGLNELTTYYFGLQVFVAGKWSYITTASSVSATTTEILDATMVPNRIELFGALFDSLTNKIIVNWKVNSGEGFDTLELEAGLTWAPGGFSATPPSPPVTGKIVRVLALDDTVRTEIDLGSSILFDTTYYVSFWLRRVNGKWSKPIDKSSQTVRIPAVAWQAVTYFRETDTVYALNGSVVLSKADNWTSAAGTITDTILKFAPATVPEGFIQVGTGFMLKHYQNSQPFNIGLSYESIPRDFGEKDIRLYHYIDSSGMWIVNHRAVVDSSRQIVSVFAKSIEFPYPFILMIDTARPSVTFLTDTAGVVESAVEILNQIRVKDNVGNVMVSLWCSKGTDSLSLQQSGEVAGYTGIVDRIIPASFIREDNGVRALMIVSDGHYVDTFDISRNVIRSNSDIVATEENAWTPLRATAVLDNPEVQSALDELAKDGTWSYDSIQFRLFRWIKHSGNETRPDQWVQYSDNDEIRNMFQFTPGRVIWIKTRESIPLDLGRGSTVTMKRPCEITLKANDWTDFGLPFRFAVRIGDIIQETGLQNESDSLWFYEWEADGNLQYSSAGLFVPTIPDLSNSGRDLDYSARKAYTVYNALNKDVVLKIPAIASNLSDKPAALTKKGSSGSWSVAAIARLQNGAKLSPLYCGYSKKGRGNSVFPIAPSFSKVSMAVIDPASKKPVGSLIAHGDIGNGVAYQIVFANNSSSPQTLQLDLDRGSFLPDQMKTQWFAPQNGTGINSQKQSASLTIASGDRAYRWLLVGDASYIGQFARDLKTYDLALLKPYPNPARGKTMHFRFTVPFSGVRRVKLSVFDQLGREVWGKVIDRELLPGVNTVSWNPLGQRAAGMYFIKLDALDSSSRSAGVRLLRMTYLPN